MLYPATFPEAVTRTVALVIAARMLRDGAASGLVQPDLSVESSSTFSTSRYRFEALLRPFIGHLGGKLLPILDRGSCDRFLERIESGSVHWHQARQ